MKPAISVRGVSKRFRLGVRGHRSYRTLRDSLATGARGAARWLAGAVRRRTAPTADSELWALKGVSFEVHPGEVIGVVGANGAGKSTLLKLVSRITAPTEGEIRLTG